MSNTNKDSSNQENMNSEERKSLEILGGKRMWDKAGTGFSMPYQKPSQTKGLYHADVLRESNERLGIKPTNSESSSTDDNSIEITFFKKK
jgi:hypothetical protein